MRDEFGLHEPAVEDARHGTSGPKIEEYGNSLFAVLQRSRSRAMSFKSRDGHLRRPELHHPRFACTASADSRGARPVRARATLLKHGAAYVFYALMDAVVDRYFPILDALESGARADRGADLRAQHRALQTSKPSMP
jgi:magnesium transporter